MRRLLRVVDHIADLEVDGDQTQASARFVPPPVAQGLVPPGRELHLDGAVFLEVIHTKGLGTEAAMVLLAMALLCVRTADGSELLVPHHLETIASVAGTTRRTASKYLNLLDEKGFVIRPEQERRAGRFGQVCWRIPLRYTPAVRPLGAPPDALNQPPAPSTRRLDASQERPTARGSTAPGDVPNDEMPGHDGGKELPSGASHVLPYLFHEDGNEDHEQPPPDLAPAPLGDPLGDLLDDLPDALPSGPVPAAALPALLSKLGFADPATGVTTSKDLHRLIRAVGLLPGFRNPQQFVSRYDPEVIGAQLGQLALRQASPDPLRNPGGWLRSAVRAATMPRSAPPPDTPDPDPPLPDAVPKGPSIATPAASSSAEAVPPPDDAALAPYLEEAADLLERQAPALASRPGPARNAALRALALEIWRKSQ